MKLKMFPKRKLLIIFLVGFDLFLIVFIYFAPESSWMSTTSVPVNILAHSKSISTKNTIIQDQKNTVYGLPVRLKILSINIDAAIEYVGLTKDGAMDVPKNPDNIAWLETGKRPGEIGTAVVAGHYGTWKNGKGSVFDDLHKLQKGDKISVNDNNGNSVSFVVSDIKSYEPNADASDVFGSNDGLPHLNLITCEGTWNKQTKSYSKRLVVFTNKE